MSKEVVLIDRDELLKHEVMIITKGNAAFHGVPSSLIEIAPVIGLKSLWPVWRDPETDPPKVEEEVLIMYQTASGGCGITTAHYEDGTLLSQDSIFCWDELAAWGELDEEHDDYIIPKGWWEYRHLNQDEVYNNRVDYPVRGWMPLPPEVLRNDKDALNSVDEAPTIDPKTLRLVAHWEEIPGSCVSSAGKSGSWCVPATRCTNPECGEVNPCGLKTPFCPMCGSRMEDVPYDDDAV